MTIRLASVLVATALLAAGGCRPAPPRHEAWRAELARRQADAAKSVELCRQGMEAHERDDLDGARSLLSEAVEVDETNAHAWMALGVTEMDRDNLFEAAAAFDRAGRLEPSRYEPHYNIGLLYETAGRYGRAAEAYEIALQLAPDQNEVLGNLARCYIRSNTQLHRAKELIDRALTTERRPEWLEWLQRQSMRLTPKPKAGP